MALDELSLKGDDLIDYMEQPGLAVRRQPQVHLDPVAEFRRAARSLVDVAELRTVLMYPGDCHECATVNQALCRARTPQTAPLGPRAEDHYSFSAALGESYTSGWSLMTTIVTSSRRRLKSR